MVQIRQHINAAESKDSPSVAELRFIGVEASLGNVLVLKGVTAELSGGVTALVGRNGAGKTTLIRVVVGALPMSAGQVLREGVDISGAAALRSHRKTLGWLPQEPGLPLGCPSVLCSLRGVVERDRGRVT